MDALAQLGEQVGALLKDVGEGQVKDASSLEQVK